LAIDASRWRKTFDKISENHTFVLETQGREECETDIHNIKRKIFGSNFVKSKAEEQIKKIPLCSRLSLIITQWDKCINELLEYESTNPKDQQAKLCFKKYKKAMQVLKKIIHYVRKIRSEEWQNTKNYYIRIGKYGNIARITNPKIRSGPVASNTYPTKPGGMVKKPTNDEERREASILTHTVWMNNPLGVKNCHFIDILEDEVGPQGVSIQPNKQFDSDAQ